MSNTDITVDNYQAIDKIVDREKHLKIMTFKYVINGTQNLLVKVKTRINIQKALDLTNMEMVRIERSLLSESNPINIDSRVALTELLAIVAEKTIPKRKTFEGKPVWWSKRLETMERDMYQKRRTYL